jgi:hypothetical protein
MENFDKKQGLFGFVSHLKNYKKTLKTLINNLSKGKSKIITFTIVLKLKKFNLYGFINFKKSFNFQLIRNSIQK